MRVYLTSPEIATETGSQLFQLLLQLSGDGKLDVEKIKSLWRWLVKNKENREIAAVAYLNKIMTRITADKVIDKDELAELHLAIERVIPATHREATVRARKKRETDLKTRLREKRKAKKEYEAEERKRIREEEFARTHRIRHCFAKVAGVTYLNKDGSNRQKILSRCKNGEQLVLQHEPNNKYSEFAIRVIRANGEQLGHAPEYLAERICEETGNGYRAFGMLLEVTGGNFEAPIYGANFAVFFISQDATDDELNSYARKALSAERDS
ncbi:MAG: HIRAN domain-containing protein [Gemmataceae bacterium]